MLRNNKSKCPQIRLNSEASGSLSDAKDFSGNDSASKSSQPKSDTKVRPKILQKSKVVSSRYKSAAIEATKKNLSSSSDSSRTISPYDKSRTKSRVVSGLAKSSNFLKPGAGSAEKPNLTLLHSTAVNSSTFLEKTRSSPEEFSTTIVGGQNRFHQNKNSNVTISQLPDISEICHSIPTTVVSAPTDKKLAVDQKKIYTKEDLNKEYLEYLIWAHIDKRSEQAFDKQVKEAQKQISCLSQLLEQEEEETAEVRQKLKILNQFERSARLHERMKDQLISVNETIDPCDKAIEDLSRHLEFQMSQIKLENIYMPSDEPNYKEKLTESLMANNDILTELNSNVEDAKNFLQSASSLFTNVVDAAGKIESVLSLGEKVAGLKIQESSLKLSQMEEDRAF